MSIHHDHDNDNDAEHQARVDRMINEFLEAQSRRFGKPTGNVVDSTLDANLDLEVPRLVTTISPFRLIRTDRG